MINLITPPDILYNKTTSILLIHPSKTVKEQLNDVLKDVQQDIDIYLYESEDEHEWVLNLHRICNLVIIDIDNCPSSTRDAISYFIGFASFHICFASLQFSKLSRYSTSSTRDAISYFIGFSNTFWLTNGDNMYYNKISNNRIFNLDWIGGKLEKTA